MSEPLFRRVDRILLGIHSRGLYTRHPYNLNDISAIILAETQFDRVTFTAFPEGEHGIIDGFIKVSTFSDGVYAGDVNVADVYYRDTLAPAWKNFIVCKELCQLLWQSLPAFRVSSRSELVHLVSNLLEGKTPAADDCSVAKLTEDAAMCAAMEILVPFEFRVRLMESKVECESIAERFGVPEFVVKYLFHEEYHNYMLSQGRAELLKQKKPRLVSGGTA